MNHYFRNIFTLFFFMSIISNAHAEGPHTSTKLLTGAANVFAGDFVEYQIQFACNSLTGDCGNLSITDNLPAELEIISCTAPVGFTVTCPVGGNNVTVIKDTVFDGGDTFQLSIRSRVRLGTPGGTMITNTATTTITDGPGGNPQTNTPSAPPVTVQPGVADYIMHKTITDPPAPLGPALDADVIYDVQMCATSAVGNENMTGVVMVDTFPAGAFVFDADGGTIAGNTITWNIPDAEIALATLYATASLTSEQCVTRTITLIYPSATFGIGNPVNNTIVGSGTPAGGPGTGFGPGNDTDTTMNVIVVGAIEPGAGKVADDVISGAGEGPMIWAIDMNTDTANVAVSDFIIYEAIPNNGLPNANPPNIFPLSITSGQWNSPINFNGTTDVRATIEFSTDVVATPDLCTTASYAGNILATNIASPVASVNYPLPANATCVRWVLTDVSANLDAPATPRHWAFTTQPLLTLDTQTVPGPYPQVVENCLVTTFTLNGVSTIDGPDCFTANIEDPTVAIASEKIRLAPSGDALPGQEVQERLTFTHIEGDSTVGAVDPVVADLLPPELEFVSWDAYNVAGGLNPPNLEVIPNYAGTGRTMVRFSWSTVAVGVQIDGSPGVANSETFSETTADADMPQMDITLKVKDGTPAGVYTNELAFFDRNPTGRFTCGAPASEPGVDLSGNNNDGAGTNADDLFCRGTDPVGVLSSAVLGGSKWVKGDGSTGDGVNTSSDDPTSDPSIINAACPDVPNGSDFTRFPCAAWTDVGGNFEYELRLVNAGNIGLQDYTLYDVLPNVGDTGVGPALSFTARESRWRPELAGAITIVPGTLIDGVTPFNPFGVVLEYSTAANPCRDDLADPSMPNVCDADYGALPGALDTVTAYRIKVPFATAWPPGATFTLRVPMVAPVNAPPSIDADAANFNPAWNSFAHVARQEGAATFLLPAEPRKVGIVVPPSFRLGNLVWVDTNRNGIAEVGEPGIPNVNVELRQDDDGSAGPTAGDTIVNSMLTDVDGHYMFENLGPNDYYINIPVGQDGVGGPLENYFQTDVGEEASPNSDGDNNDNGTLTVAGLGLASGVVTLGPMFNEPTGEQNRNGSGSDEIDFYPDALSNLTVDIGYWRPFSLGNQVWLDDGPGADFNNGIFDVSESGIDGITVRLLNSDATPFIDTSTMAAVTTITANGGYYLFENIPARNYIVELDLTSGAGFTHLSTSTGANANTGPFENPPDADGNATDEDDNGQRINNSTIRSLTVTIGASDVPAEPTAEAGAVDATLVNGQGTAPDGTALPDIQANVTVDFGLFESYSVGNRVWFDDNDSGTIDGIEAGINNVTVNLYDAADLNSILDTMTTNANGYYRFDFLRAGDYVVEAETPAGTHSSTPNAGDPDADLDEDDDNGVDIATHAGFAMSDAITVGPGASEQLTDVKDGPGDTTLAAVDDHNDMSVDFGFVKEFSLGNRVWLDANNNGVIDATENGINGVTVNLYEDFDTNGAPDGPVVATMVTIADGLDNGYYRFDDLLTGTYMVEIDATNFAGPLTDLISSTPDAGDPDADADDSDDNGSDLATTMGAVFSAPVTLGQADDEPLTEADLGVGGQGTTLDSRANMTVDFGFFEPLSLGNLVWIDTDNNGTLNGVEIGHPLVTVQVYRDTDANGIFNPANDTLIDTDITDANGFYLFTELGADNYFVHIPVANFGPAQALAGYSTSTGADALLGPSEPAASPEDDADTVDDGSFSLVTNGTVSLPVTLAPNSEVQMELPTATGNPGDDGAGTPDNDSNLTVDFGFYQSVSIGSTVFEDTDNSGHQDGGEVAIANVDVELWHPGVDGVIGGGDDVMIDTTTTSGTGDYIFANLPVGDYYVVVPAINFNAGNALENLASSSYPTVTADVITDDGDDHGEQSGGSGTVTTSPLINLSLGAEPIDGVDETEQGNLQDNDIIDENGDMTVDFGFFNPVNPMSLGSTVFLDPNNNGQHEATEAGIPAVDLELWSTGADGIIGGTDDVQVSTTTTDGVGDYIFTNLDEGNYFVIIPTPPVADPFSSTPTAIIDNNIDGNDDGAQPGGIGTQVTSPVINLTAGAEVDNTIETEIGVGGAQDDALIETNGNMTIDFGFTNPANLVSIGSTVFEDPDNSGTQAAVGEPGIPGVDVELWLPGLDGVIGGGDDLLFATDTTNGTGDYFFENLAARDYFVVIPTNNFAVAGPLEFLPLSSSPTSVADDQTDGDDNGEQAAGSGTQTVSPLITLAVGAEPQAVDETAVSGGNQDDAYEDNGDMTIDFGFFLPANPVSLGSTLFIDIDNDGIHEVGDNGIPAIDVELWSPGADTVIGGGDDVQVGTDVTDGNGNYFFENLAEGDYFVLIPTPPATHPRSSTPTSNADNVDGNDDGIQLGGIGTVVNSEIVNLQAGAEVDNTVEIELGLGGAQDDAADTSGNMTVDFGFITPGGLVSIGSTVYEDINNSGTQDIGENGIPAVIVELWTTGSDGVIGGGDDVMFGAEATDGIGNFIFIKLPSGNYYLKVPASNFTGAGALTSIPLSSVPTSLLDDQDDILENGVQSAGAGTETVSPVINLSVGLEPLNIDEPSSGGMQDDDGGDANGDMTIDFGFLAPVIPVSIGSTVFLDPDNNGTHDVGEAGIPAIDLELWSPGIDGVKGGGDDLQISVTVTDGNGDYLFDNLPEGDYYIVLPTPPVVAPMSSTPTTGGDDQTDGDDNGDQVNIGDMVMSVIINLTPGAEPDDAVEDEIGVGGDQDNAGDTNGDMTIDFGFTDPAVLVSLGSTIYLDPDNSGTQAVAEIGVAGVTVEFWSPGLDGVIGGGDDVLEDSMLTNGSGDYFFNFYPPGDYFVIVPASNFNAGQPLENTPFSSVPTILIDNQVDSDDHGVQPNGPGTMVVSPLINLAVGAEPLNPDEIGITGGNQDDLFDANGDMTVDFGFLAVGTPVSIGSTVFVDLNNNGFHDIGENGIPAIDLELWWPGADGVKGGGDDVQIDSTTTDGNGDYIFDGLPPGDYYVVIPIPPVAIPLSSTPPTGGDDQTDGDDNGDQVNSGDMVMSVIINLTPGAEPDDIDEDELGVGGDQDNGADTDGDMTIDFGFVDPATLLSIGSTVFHDPNDSGFHDATEDPISDVAIELWSPGVDSVIGGGDDVLLDSTVTDANGDYYFGLLPTGLYFVVVPESNFLQDATLVLLSKSSVPTSIADDGVDGDDNGAQPGGPRSIVYSPIISLVVDDEPVNATETEQGNLQDDADDDNGDMTIDFGFKSPIPEIIPTLNALSLVLMSLLMLILALITSRKYLIVKP